MADRIHLDGKTYMPIAEAAALAAIAERDILAQAREGKVLLRAIGSKVYINADELDKLKNMEIVSPHIKPAEEQPTEAMSVVARNPAIMHMPAPPPVQQLSRSTSLATTAAAGVAFMLVLALGVAAYEYMPALVRIAGDVRGQLAQTASYDRDDSPSQIESGQAAFVANASEGNQHLVADSGAAASTTQPIYYVYNYPVIERVREEIQYIEADTPQDFRKELDALYARIQQQIQSLNISTNTNFAQQYQVIAQTNRIDQLGSASISDSSYSGGTIDGSTLTNISFGTGVLVGIGSGGTGTSTAPSYGQLLLGNSAGGYNLAATSSLGITAASTTVLADNNTFSGTNSFTGNVTLTNATSTNFFSTTASSTNLFAQTAQFGTLSVLGALTQTGLGTFQNGFVSQASSTVVGAFTNTGAATFGSTLAASGLSTLAGLRSIASSTIGDGTAAGGLTISGGATTTGNAYFAGSLGVGTTSPFAKLSVSTVAQQSGDLPLFEIASTTNTSILRVNGNGNVGIGATNPMGRLAISSANLSQTWSQLGTGLSIAHGTPALAALSPNRVAFVDSTSFNGTLRTYEFNGATWSLIGSGLSISSVGTPALAALSPNRVAFVDFSSNALRTYEFNGSTWSQVGTSLSVSAATVGMTALGPNRIAYANGSDDTLRTYEFNGTAWSQVGNALSVSNDNPAVATLAPNRVAFIDSANDTLRVYEFNGGDWSEIGPGLSISTVGTPKLATLSPNRVAFVDSTNASLRVYELNGTTWSLVGTGFTVSAFAATPALAALSPNRVAYINGQDDSLVAYQFSMPLLYLADSSDKLFFTVSDAGYTTAESVDVRSMLSIGQLASTTASTTPTGIATTSPALVVNGNAMFQGGIGLGTSTPWALISISPHVSSAVPSFFIGTSTRADLIVTNAGNVGIGTSTPNNKLSVYSATKSAIEFTGGSSAGSFTMGYDVSNGRFSIASSTALGTTDRFVISSTGNVGIGTSLPQAQLDVSRNTGSSTIDPADIQISSLASAADFDLTNSWGNLDFHSEDGSGNIGSGVRARVGAIFETVGGSATGLAFSTSNVTDTDVVERLRINSSGNVGIGTTTPNSRLHVNGNQTYNSATPNFIVNDDTGRTIGIWGSHISRTDADIDSVSIGINYLGYNGGTTRFRDFIVYNGKSSEILVVDGSDGSVGIASTTPSATLAINGTFMATSTTGNVIATNAQGAQDSGAVYTATGVFMKAAAATPFIVSILGTDTTGSAFQIKNKSGTTELSVDGTGVIFVNNNTAVGASNLCWDGSGSSNWGACTSLSKWKTNVEAFDGGLEEILALEAVTFDWKRNADGTLSSTTVYATLEADTGFIADQVASVSYNFGRYDTETGELRDVNDRGVMGAMVNAIKELNFKVESLSTTTPYAMLEDSSFVKRFFDRLIAWFADAANGIGTMAASTFLGSELCLRDGGGTTCYTRADLDAAISGQRGNQTSGGDSSDDAESEDTVDPVINVQGANPATINIGDTYSDLGATVTDAGSPNIGIEARVNDGEWGEIGSITIDTSMPGTHTVEYRATDQAGNVGTASRTVNVVDPNAPTDEPPVEEPPVETPPAEEPPVEEAPVGGETPSTP